MSYLTQQFGAPAPPLATAVARAYYHNRFYRAKLERAGIAPDAVLTAEELTRVPMTTRDELAGDPWALLAGDRSDVSQVHISTGTSERPPLYVFFSWDDLFRRGLMPLGAGVGFGIKEGERVVNALPYEVSVTGLAIQRALQDGMGACVVAAGKGGAYADPGKTLRIMRAIEADHLFTTPSYALRLAEIAGDEPPVALRSIWLVGEPCVSGLRRLIERRWEAPAFLYYGSLECGPIGLECPRQDGYHVAANFVHVELAPIALPGRPDLADRLGEIVVTTLWRYASPLLRFRTEDVGVWDETPCACGVPGRRLRVLGRLADLMADVMPPRFVTEIEEVVLDVPGASPWFRLCAGRRPRVMLPEPAGRGVPEAVRDALARRLGVTVDVVVGPPTPPPGGKLRRLVREPRS